MPPPFTPWLLAGLPLPRSAARLLQGPISLAFTAVRRRHPDFARILDRFGDATVAIAPLDLPLVFVLRANGSNLQVLHQDDAPAADATIRAAMDTLLALAEGNIDGDAAFFARRLTIEGDTEIVLRLRNAMDGAGINVIADLASACGPLAGVVRRGLEQAIHIHSRLSRDLLRLRDALIAPALGAVDAQAGRLAEMELRLAALSRRKSHS